MVLLVIDQWPAWAFEQKRPYLVAGGFDRLLSEGRWQTGEHPSASTLTGPGHALLSTGAPPCASGILANEWYRRELDRTLTSIEGPQGPDASWLRAPGLADGIPGKAVSVSLKARSAILSLGHRGLPIWYDPERIAWTTRTAPAWLAEHQRNQPLEREIHTAWVPLDPRWLAERTRIADDALGELGEKKLDGTFPHEPDATGAPADALFATPAGDRVVLDAAIAAIAGEQLGRDATPDLLVVSLSAHDYVGHGWGHESWEMWDAERRLDAELARFLAELDRAVGAGRWSMVVTSDHGASPVPERAGDGGRITYERVREVANHAAVRVLGEGTWIADAKYPNVYFSRALHAAPERERERAIAAVIEELTALPGIALVDRTERYTGNCAEREGDARAICSALDRERSGDLVYLTRPHWILHDADEPTATAHGSLHAYDRRVPLIVLPPGRVPHAPLTAPAPAPVPMTEVAPLLGRWLGVTLTPPRC